MSTLYPPIMPYSTGFLQVDDVHQLYWEQAGNPEGVPVLFLHGGPGGGASARHRQWFDPNHYRVILFDQRGAGRSHPLGNLEHNSPADLVADIEKIRIHLKIDRWHVFGGSWGSTLALLYASQHAEQCLGFILHGIFLFTQAEIEWFARGIQKLYPEAHRAWLSFLDEAEQNDPIKGFYNHLTTGTMAEQIAASQVWCTYESACIPFTPEAQHSKEPEEIKQEWAMARIESHYYTHYLLQNDASLLEYVRKFSHLPAIIVHGRYDILCPMAAADSLHRVWPASELVIIPDGGHSSREPSMQRALIEATRRMRSVKL